MSFAGCAFLKEVMTPLCKMALIFAQSASLRWVVYAWNIGSSVGLDSALRYCMQLLTELGLSTLSKQLDAMKKLGIALLSLAIYCMFYTMVRNYHAPILPC